MELKIKKLYSDAILPTKGSEEAAGLDLYSYIEGETEFQAIMPKTGMLIKTGISVEIPKGYFGGIYARSGLATSQGLRPANCVGVIDSDYRGEIMIYLYNDSDTWQNVYKNTRIAQLIIQPYAEVKIEEVNKLNDTERGEGGFGSTGVK